MRLVRCSHAEVERFFDGLDLIEPGLVAVPQWRPWSPAEAGARSAMWGGVATATSTSIMITAVG